MTKSRRTNFFLVLVSRRSWTRAWSIHAMARARITLLSILLLSSAYVSVMGVNSEEPEENNRKCKQENGESCRSEFSPLRALPAHRYFETRLWHLHKMPESGLPHHASLRTGCIQWRLLGWLINSRKMLPIVPEMLAIACFRLSNFVMGYFTFMPDYSAIHSHRLRPTNSCLVVVMFRGSLGFLIRFCVSSVTAKETCSRLRMNFAMHGIMYMLQI